MRPHTWLREFWCKFKQCRMRVSSSDPPSTSCLCNPLPASRESAFDYVTPTCHLFIPRVGKLGQGMQWNIICWWLKTKNKKKFLLEHDKLSSEVIILTAFTPCLQNVRNCDTLPQSPLTNNCSMTTSVFTLRSQHSTSTYLAPYTQTSSPKHVA